MAHLCLLGMFASLITQGEVLEVNKIMGSLFFFFFSEDIELLGAVSFLG